jgi:hypothetical protein
MKKHKFSWVWANAWPEYKLAGEPFFALINPSIWDQVTESRSGEIEVTKKELFGE